MLHVAFSHLKFLFAIIQSFSHSVALIYSNLYHVTITCYRNSCTKPLSCYHHLLPKFLYELLFYTVESYRCSLNVFILQVTQVIAAPKPCVWSCFIQPITTDDLVLPCIQLCHTCYSWFRLHSLFPTQFWSSVTTQRVSKLKLLQVKSVPASDLASHRIKLLTQDKSWQLSQRMSCLKL
jgi:hypothetical protein